MIFRVKNFVSFAWVLLFLIISVPAKAGITEEESKDFFALLEKYKVQEIYLGMDFEKADVALVSKGYKLIKKSKSAARYEKSESSGDLKQMQINLFNGKLKKISYRQQFPNSVHLDQEELSNKILKKYGEPDLTIKNRFTYFLAKGPERSSYVLDMVNISIFEHGFTIGMESRKLVDVLNQIEKHNTQIKAQEQNNKDKQKQKASIDF